MTSILAIKSHGGVSCDLVINKLNSLQSEFLLIRNCWGLI